MITSFTVRHDCSCPQPLSVTTFPLSKLPTQRRCVGAVIYQIYSNYIAVYVTHRIITPLFSPRNARLSTVPGVPQGQIKGNIMAYVNTTALPRVINIRGDYVITRIGNEAALREASRAGCLSHIEERRRG